MNFLKTLLGLVFGVIIAGVIVYAYDNPDMLPFIGICSLLAVVIFLGSRMQSRAEQREHQQQERTQTAKDMTLAFVITTTRNSKTYGLTKGNGLGLLKNRNPVKRFRLFENPLNAIRQLTATTEYEWSAQAVKVDGRNFEI